MSAHLENTPVSRYLLAPAMLAVLIAGPFASLVAGQWGVSWWMVFLVTAGALAIFWDIAILREAREGRPLAAKKDPVFGSMHSFELGLWELDELVKMEGAWLPVAIAAGSDGPSSEQRDTYRDFLKFPSQYREQLVDALIRQAGEQDFPGLTPVRIFLPDVSEAHGTNLEIEVQVDGDGAGPHAEVVSFHAGQATNARAA
ncbi:MAG: hypothetical protein ACI9X4_002258 [Glaciecola sp.]|jgi:hypothetical protein